MAEAKKCDRCGNFYDCYVTLPRNFIIFEKNVGSNAVAFINADEDEITKQIELCPSCMRAFKKFIKFKEDNHEENTDTVQEDV